jgi:hypothetical protein
MKCACSTLPSVACPALNYFPLYVINGTTFEKKKKLLIIKCVFLFSPQGLSEILLILRRIDGDMMKMYVVLHVKHPLFLSDFNET